MPVREYDLMEEVKKCPCYMCVVRPVCVYSEKLFPFGVVLRRSICTTYATWRYRTLAYLSKQQYIALPKVEYDLFFPRRKKE